MKDSGIIEKDIQEINQAVSDKESESDRSKKELVHEVVGEKIKENIPEFEAKPIEHKPNEQDQNFDIGDQENLGDKYKEKVQSLINIFVKDGIMAAIKDVEKENNPALTDYFHRVLTEKIHELIEGGFIKKL